MSSCAVTTTGSGVMLVSPSPAVPPISNVPAALVVAEGAAEIPLKLPMNVMTRCPGSAIPPRPNTINTTPIAPMILKFPNRRMKRPMGMLKTQVPSA